MCRLILPKPLSICPLSEVALLEYHLHILLARQVLVKHETHLSKRPGMDASRILETLIEKLDAMKSTALLPALPHTESRNMAYRSGGHAHIRLHHHYNS